MDGDHVYVGKGKDFKEWEKKGKTKGCVRGVSERV